MENLSDYLKAFEISKSKNEQNKKEIDRLIKIGVESDGNKFWENVTGDEISEYKENVEFSGGDKTKFSPFIYAEDYDLGDLIWIDDKVEELYDIKKIKIYIGEVEDKSDWTIRRISADNKDIMLIATAD